MKPGFLDKLIERLDLLDSQSLQSYFLRLAQEKGLLETIFQSIQEGIIVINENGELTYANKVAEQLLGFSMQESGKNRTISQYMRDIDWDNLLKLDRDQESKLVTREIEIAYPEHRFVSFYVIPMPAQKNKQKGMVIILRDVTYDREHEASRLESERTNAIKLLAAGVAHEIGNPLNAMNIHLQLIDRELCTLSDEKVGEQEGEGNISRLRELVKVARNEVTRLDLIITQFLRAIRPAKPTRVLSRIDELLKDTLILLKHEIQNKTIDVEVDCSESIPSIEVDRDQIKQVFFNIIKNAFEAMPDHGSLRIMLSTKSDSVKIIFQDTGIGIKQEDFRHIFEPYHTTKDDGSGLGLMIVHRIIQDHGGQMEITSAPSKGTSVTIFLPFAEHRMRLLPPSKTGNKTRKKMQKGHEQ